MTPGKGQKIVSSLDFDLDMRMNHLEIEWRQTYEDGVLALAEYRALAETPPEMRSCSTERASVWRGSKQRRRGSRQN